MENSKLMQNTINKIKKLFSKKINIKKYYFRPKFILAVAMVLAAGVGLYQVFAQVSTVNITSPTASAKAYVKSGDQVPVYFDVTTNASGTGRLRVEIYSGSTTVGDTGYYDYTFLEGANNSLLANVLINASAAEGTYNVKVSAQQPGVSGTWVYDTETGAIVVDNTPPTVTISDDQTGIASDADP
ncbi:MAG TPA: hypothetical protein P5570_00950, partial [Candidatus Paceibacterota bacterium]|nr:hypothetical protein [Candidatus Paceibacterota bacterium]